MTGTVEERMFALWFEHLKGWSLLHNSRPWNFSPYRHRGPA